VSVHRRVLLCVIQSGVCGTKNPGPFVRTILGAILE
jgi:hypothetical protein